MLIDMNNPIAMAQDLSSARKERDRYKRERDALAEELRRAFCWMDGCATREKAASYKRGYAIRLDTARSLLATIKD